MNDQTTGADTTPSVHVIVLAAGASTRFGSPKQLVRLKGRPLLHLAVSRAVEVAGQSVTVVLGANAAELAPLLRHTPATVVINRDWAEGMGSSVRTGVARVPAAADAALLMLADQPAVTAEDLRRLVGTWRRQPRCMVAAHYAGTSGVPAIFPREDFPALCALRGDAGARALLKGGGERLVRVPLPSAAIDIDTPEDLLKLP
ncbi:MAG TPA: nucleotidyltransferase family protein [Steroidobacteraceae bacterium]|nr:nucleotidyltransferase family protein [Steroidobacteraceae bacterium]